MFLALFVAAIAGTALSGGYYSVVPIEQPPVVSGREGPAPTPPPGVQAAVELARSAAVAGLVAGLVGTANWDSTIQGLLLGLALWVLPAVLLVGSVVHEGTDRRTALVHAGDWLLKLLAIGAIIGTLA